MTLSYSHGREFLEQIRPILERADTEGFIRHLDQYWLGDKLIGLLQCGHEEAVGAALAGLSLVGKMDDCSRIAALLHDDDGLTADLAEHALWSIWFRAGGPESNEQVAAAVRLISLSNLDAAGERISEVLAAHPDFAEAYHQMGLVHFLRGDYVLAISFCQATLLLNSWHFGAMALLGHCHAAGGRLEQACAAYQQALQLHPRLQGVRQAIRQIRKAAPQAPVNTFTKI
jgi:tetratricopeptide (TPR) repeat protein